MKKVLPALVFTLLLTGSFEAALAQVVTTNFSGTLTNTQSFTRPRAIGEESGDDAFYTRQLTPADLEAGSSSYNYFIQAIVPQASGPYSITISSAVLSDGNDDTFLILYADAFNPTTPLAGLMAANDDSYINGTEYTLLSELTNLSLTSGKTYYIVVTSYSSGSTGAIDFSVTGPGSVTLSSLPVRWLGFTARKEGSGVTLDWSTATEENTRDYLVQHSTDGRHWNNLATVAAAGYSSVVQDYRYVHHPVSGNENYYRLLQQDIDGKTSFSKVVKVQLVHTDKGLRLYPNPVQHQRLTVTLDTDARVEVFSAAGIRVLQKPLTAGTHPLLLPNLPKGLYTLRAGEKSQCFVVQ